MLPETHPLPSFQHALDNETLTIVSVSVILVEIKNWSSQVRVFFASS